MIQIRGIFAGENKHVTIINSDGVTEGYIAKGADIIVDAAQTGNSLEEYGLRELEQIMESSAGLYAGKTCTGWKEQKAHQIFEMLKGTVNAKTYSDLEFNVPDSNLGQLVESLSREGMFADEPTISRGKDFSAVNILIPQGKYPQAFSLIKQYRASSIVRNEVKQFVA